MPTLNVNPAHVTANFNSIVSFEPSKVWLGAQDSQPPPLKSVTQDQPILFKTDYQNNQLIQLWITLYHIFKKLADPALQRIKMIKRTLNKSNHSHFEQPVTCFQEVRDEYAYALLLNNLPPCSRHKQ